MPTVLPLDLLQPGEWAEVAAVEGNPPWVARLQEMGLQRGVRICMLQSGSPCLFQLGGSKLSLRLNDAGHVLVQPLAQTLGQTLAQPVAHVGMSVVERATECGVA